MGALRPPSAPGLSWGARVEGRRLLPALQRSSLRRRRWPRASSTRRSRHTRAALSCSSLKPSFRGPARKTPLSRELEELKEIEADLERQEREVDEDTTVTIPSAVYVAQLYRRIIHHGPSVAQPIHLESTQLSKKFISDYLWSLVDTEW
eukprot:bmy_16837T0